MYITEIKQGIHYVGVNDRTKHRFEGLWSLPYGVSYNSYLVVDDKVALIDTVDEAFASRFMSNIDEVLQGREIDYLVVNHMEADHSAAMATLRMRYPRMQIVGNAKTLQMIEGFYGITDNTLCIKEGESLSLGGRTLQFYMAPMVHWPEVMVTYDKTDKVLFSADGFGKFGALDTDEKWDCEARRYYFNIVGKYGAQVQTLLKKAAGLDIQIICPLHGPILTENLGHYIGKYDIWSKYEPENKGITVAYASIHGNTANAAKKFAEILKEQGEETVSLFDLSRDDMAEAVEDAFRYDGIVFASATYDAGLFPCMESYLEHLKAKGYRNRIAAVMENGSWAPTAGKQMRTALEGMKDITVIDKTVTIKSVMKDSDIEDMREMASELRKALNR